jgi:hypothetical protein
VKHQFVRFPLGAVFGAFLALSVVLASAQGNDLSVSLGSVGGSGVTAAATLTASGNQTVVTVSAQGLTPGSTNENEIHFGTCANTGGIAFTLSNLVPGANGTATTTDTINATLASLQDGNHEMHIHMTSAAGTVLACGNIAQAAAVAAASPTAAATATAARATAVATATAAAATVTPVAQATVAGATAVATTTATPAALPATGGLPLPIAPASALGAAAFAFGYYLRRRR